MKNECQARRCDWAKTSDKTTVLHGFLRIVTALFYAPFSATPCISKPFVSPIKQKKAALEKRQPHELYSVIFSLISSSSDTGSNYLSPARCISKVDIHHHQTYENRGRTSLSCCCLCFLASTQSRWYIQFHHRKLHLSL